MIKILIIEDNRELAASLLDLLAGAGHEGEIAATKAQGLAALEEAHWDLVLLDISLPDGSGYALCTAIKAERDLPVIMLTAMDDEASIVTGFDLGADDYVTKPFKPRELTARIKNVLARYGKAKTLYTVGPLTIDTAKATVTRAGNDLNLTALEYRLLLIFLGHRGEVLSRNRLLGELWDTAGDFVGDNTLTVYIKRLREKIEDDPAHPELIVTVRGLGYKFGD